MFANILAGSIMVVTTVVIHGLGLLAISAALRTVIGRYRPHVSLAGTIVTMVLTVLGLFLLHTIEIWAWAVAYVWVGAVPNMPDALFFSTLSFPTLGAEPISAAREWQLFGSFEGVNGFLLIGWSTAYLIPAWTRYGPFHEDRGF